jgi:hypothetical protein
VRWSRREGREGGGVSWPISGMKAILTLALVGMPISVVGQSRLIEGSARIDATSMDRVRVELDYVVEVNEPDQGGGEGPAGLREVSIPLEGIAFRPTEIESVTVRVSNGASTPMVLESSEAGRLIGAVPLPAGTVGRVEFHLSYDVRSAVEGDDPYRIRVPVLAVGWPPAEALPGVFTAEALLVGGLKVFESFPSGLEKSEVVGTVGRFTLDLPAIPALISMRATAGRIPFGGIIRILDGLVLLTLVATAIIGFRYLRATA